MMGSGAEVAHETVDYVLLFRGWFYFIQRPAPLRVRRLGWSEFAHAVTFCLLFILMAA
jgi:hypothetical protein